MTEEKSCENCDGMCCKYVATEIDEPENEDDYQHIRWFLLHKDVNVYIDHDDDWILEFVTRCEKLGPDNKCTYYDERPQICRDHNVVDCDKFGEDEPHQVKFFNVEHFEEYMKKNYKTGTQKTYTEIEKDED